MLGLIIGFSGLLLAHNITFVLMCLFFLIVLIIEYKRILNNYKMIINIMIATIISILLTAFFTFPMFEQLGLKLYCINYYFNTDMVVSNHLIDLFQF